MATVLVIDDNRQVADSLCRMLDILGVEGIPVYGPRSAMMFLNQKVPDLVLLDINMPGVDGFEVLGYLKRLPQLEKIPVVVVTSDEQSETAKRALELGAYKIIIKPPTFEAIEDLLNELDIL